MFSLNSLSESRVYLLVNLNPVGPSASLSVGFLKWTVLIGRTGFDTIYSTPSPTVSLTIDLRTFHGYLQWVQGPNGCYTVQSPYQMVAFAPR